MTAPLGSPVVPDVKTMATGRSGSSGSGPLVAPGIRRSSSKVANGPEEFATTMTAPSVVPAVAPKATPAAADAKPESTAAAAAPASTASYLEVGSFKDSAWADEAVGKLTQLGFHAVSVPKKNLLLMHSFEVQVGPYTKASDLEAARKNLAAKGFKPHAVK